jgi:methionine-gamma-lyase
VERIYYLGHISEGHRDYALYRKQCRGDGGMVAFDVVGGEPEAFRFLNSLKLMKLAVSLGSTESLAQHPATMTHAELTLEDRERIGITGKMVRLSIGVEDPEDLKADVEQALEAV